MLKIGVLGAGHLGKVHLKLLKEIESYELIGFYDPSDENAKAVIQEFKISRFSTIDELIEKVDVVDIVTTTLSHYECAVKAIKNFKHIFIEKPLTSTLDEAKHLQELLREAGVKLQVGHVERFNPAFIAAKPYIDSPMFIEAHRLAQFNPRGTDVSVVLDLMIHDIDIILSVVHSTIKRISASGVPVVTDSPDIANARIEFDNGCVANLTASRISTKNMRKTRFFQRDAYISIDFLDKEAKIFKLKSLPYHQESMTEKPSASAIIIDLGKEKGKKQICFETLVIPQLNSIKKELESFAEAIIQDTTPIVTLEDGLSVLSVAHQIIDKIKIICENFN